MGEVRSKEESALGIYKSGRSNDYESGSSRRYAVCGSGLPFAPNPAKVSQMCSSCDCIYPHCSPREQKVEPHNHLHINVSVDRERTSALRCRDIGKRYLCIKTQGKKKLFFFNFFYCVHSVMQFFHHREF